MLQDQIRSTTKKITVNTDDSDLIKTSRLNNQNDATSTTNTEEFIEDYLDQPGTIEKAMLHGSAQKILQIPKTFDQANRVRFCNDCYLPEEKEGIVQRFRYCTDIKDLAFSGYNLYLFFFFIKYLITNIIALLLINSVITVLLTNQYANELSTFCGEFYINTTDINTLNGYETNADECVNFIKGDNYTFIGLDIFNKFSGETMLSYVKLFKKFHSTKQVDNVITNFNILTFITLICLFILNLFFLNLSTAYVDEIDFNEESPSDYAVMVSDIPQTRMNADEIKNDFPQEYFDDIYEVNMTYKLRAIAKIKEQLRQLKKLRRLHKKDKTFYVGCCACKKLKHMDELKKEILTLSKQVYKLEETKEFTGVAFFTFQKEKTRYLFYKKFPHSFLNKLFQNFKNCFCLCCCRCCLSKSKKKKYQQIQRLTVSKAPEPQDIIWEHLEYSFCQRFIRGLLLYFLSIILMGISFGCVLGLTTLQYNSEQKYEDNFILKYGVSLSISAVIAIINFLITMVFKYLAPLEKPWTHTQLYLSLSIKLTVFTFFNAGIIPLVTNGILYGWDSYDMLVSNMLMLFLTGSILSPLISLTHYDVLMQCFFQWLIERKHHNKSKTLKDYTQRDLNSYYEGPSMGISCQYSTLAKQILMTFFYMPIFPLGAVLTLIGYILVYVVEKFKLLRVYKKPEMLNQEICFFYLDYFAMAFFVYGIGNYIFFAGTHSSNAFELVNIIIFPILALLPYHRLFRKIDSTGAYQRSNDITYENAYLSFSFDYERMNPITQRQGMLHYLDRLESKGLISKKEKEITINQLDRRNLMELFYFSKQTSGYMGKEFFKAATLKEETYQSGGLRRDKTVTNVQYNKFCFFMNGVDMLEKAMTKRVMDGIKEEENEEEDEEKKSKKDNKSESSESSLGFDQEDLFGGNTYLLGKKFSSAAGGVLNNYLKKNHNHEKIYINSKQQHDDGSVSGLNDNLDIPYQDGHYVCHNVIQMDPSINIFGGNSNHNHNDNDNGWENVNYYQHGHYRK